MIFENNKFVTRGRTQRLLIALFFAINLSIVVYLEIDSKEGFNIYRTAYGIIILLAYLAYNYLRIKKKYNYIYISDDDYKLVVRFYHLVLFGREFKTYEIDKSELYKYEIKESNGIKELYLYLKKGNKVGHYPQIPLSAIKKSELPFITAILDKYVQVS